MSVIVLNLLGGRHCDGGNSVFLADGGAARTGLVVGIPLNTYVRITALVSDCHRCGRDDSGFKAADSTDISAWGVYGSGYGGGGSGAGDVRDPASVLYCQPGLLPIPVAIRRTSLILYCGVINLVLDVILNIVLMRWYGVAGIALATSLWTVSTFVFLCYWTYRLLPNTGGDGGASPMEEGPVAA